MRTRHPSPWMARSAAVQPLVLVVEDELLGGQSLVSTLASHGFRTLQVAAHAKALTRAVEHQPHLVLVDIAGPAVDAAGLTARLREWGPAPILVLLDRERDRTAVLDAGANDFLVKPFAIGDLLARMRVWLRQTARTHSAHFLPDVRADRVRIDHDRRSLFVEGREIHITPIECKLLLALLRSPGRAMSEDQMLTALWGPGASTRTLYLRAHVRQLRQKIERDPARPRHLVNEVGGGYRLKLT
jgi:two-component system KDP operon response regulator KdpE